MNSQSLSSFQTKPSVLQQSQIPSRIKIYEENIREVQSNLKELSSLTIRIDFQMSFKKFLKDFIMLRGNFQKLDKEARETLENCTSKQENEYRHPFKDRFAYFEKEFVAFKREFDDFASDNLKKCWSTGLN